MRTVTKKVSNIYKGKMLKTIESILNEFVINQNLSSLSSEISKTIEKLDTNISQERLEKGWLDEKGQPLSNLIKRYIPREFQKAKNWNNYWSKIVNEVKKLIITTEIEYWEREVEFFDTEEYNKYNWGDNRSCFKEDGINEIVKYLLNWNSQYVKLGLFKLKRENYTYYGRLWIFQFEDCFIITNLYCSYSDAKYEFYHHILDLIMDYHHLNKDNWIYQDISYRSKPFHWFYWNSDNYAIMPKTSNSDQLLDQLFKKIKNLPINIKCNQKCDTQPLMKTPRLESGVVYCYECRLGICCHCKSFSYNATESSNGALCEDCTYYCEICDQAVDPDHILVANGTYYCKDCFDQYFTYCTKCNELIESDDAYWVDREPYCEDCFDRYFFICNNCHRIYDKRQYDIYQCIDALGQEVIYCYDCYFDLTIECPICERDVHTNYMKKISENKEICKDCYRKHYNHPTPYYNLTNELTSLTSLEK